MRKYIFCTGGVISSVGKGVAAASIGLCPAVITPSSGPSSVSYPVQTMPKYTVDFRVLPEVEVVDRARSTAGRA